MKTSNNNTGIYGILNTANGKWYVGQSVNIPHRLDQHKSQLKSGTHKNKHLQSAWNRRGEDAFLCVTLELCDIDALNEREMFWISEKNAFHGGYNKTEGGEGLRGWNAPEWYRKQRSEMYSGENNPFFGRKHTDSTREKLRETHRGERHVNYGKHLSTETRAKISAAHIGMKHSDATKQKLSAMNKGKPPSPEALKKAAEHTSSANNPMCKPVICLTTNNWFFSAAEAARATGLERSKISACCRGERKTTGGMQWAFAKTQIDGGNGRLCEPKGLSPTTLPCPATTTQKSACMATSLQHARRIGTGTRLRAILSRWTTSCATWTSCGRRITSPCISTPVAVTCIPASAFTTA